MLRRFPVEVFGLLILTGCSREDDAHHPAPKTEVCLIDTLHRQMESRPGSTTVLMYNAENRLAELTTYTSSGNHSRILRYNENWIEVRWSSTTTSLVRRDSMVLNERGYVSYIRSYPDETNSLVWNEGTNIYNAAGELEKAISSNSSSSNQSVKNYTWSNGNLESIGSMTGKYEYYSDLAYRPGDGLEWSYKAHLSFPIFKNANLVKHYVLNNQIATAYAHEFDAKGKIVKTITTGYENYPQPHVDSFVTTDSYHYLCR